MKKIEDNKLAQDFVSYVACQASKNPNLHGFSSIKESGFVKHQQILSYLACQASTIPKLHGLSSIKESYVTWLVKHQRILSYVACQA